MPSTDIWEIAAFALACSVPVVVAGAVLIRFPAQLLEELDGHSVGMPRLTGSRRC